MLSERASSRVLWVGAFALLAAALTRLGPVVAAQLAAPFDLISEGPHLCTVQAIVRGYDIYDPRSFLDFPFFMTPYAPLYHLIVAILPQRADNPFFTGRAMTMICMIGAAASLLAAAGPQRRALALIAAAVFFLIRPVTGNTAYLRSDGLAACFAAWAVVAAWRTQSGRGAILSGVLCALAVAAKQSFLAAGITCLLWFAVAQRRRAPAFLLGGLVAGATLALAATAYWGVNFWIAMTIPATDYPRDMESFFLHWKMMFVQPLFVLVLVLAATITLVVTVTGRRAALATPFLAYMLIAWALQTWVLTGIGAENHDLIEPILATLLWIVVAVRHQPALRLEWRWGLALTALATAVAMELRNPDPSSYSATTPVKTERYVRARSDMRAALAASGLDHGPMLNLKNSQVVHDYGGEFAVNDLWMYVTVLWNTRPETVDRLVHAIETERFDGIFVSSGVTTSQNDDTTSPWGRIIHAVFAHYRLTFHGLEVNVLTRRGNARPAA